MKTSGALFISHDSGFLAFPWLVTPAVKQRHRIRRKKSKGKEHRYFNLGSNSSKCGNTNSFILQVQKYRPTSIVAYNIITLYVVQYNHKFGNIYVFVYVQCRFQSHDCTHLVFMRLCKITRSSWLVRTNLIPSVVRVFTDQRSTAVTLQQQTNPYTILSSWFYTSSTGW